MSELVAVWTTANERKHCSRCRSLGLTAPTILASERYVSFRKVWTKGFYREIAAACDDCFERLRIEAENLA